MMPTLSSSARRVTRARSASSCSLRMTTSPDRKSTRLNSSHSQISYAVFCLKKKKKDLRDQPRELSSTAVPCPSRPARHHARQVLTSQPGEVLQMSQEQQSLYTRRERLCDRL